MRKIILCILVSAFAVFGFLYIFLPQGYAATVVQLQDEISKLQAQVQSLVNQLQGVQGGNAVLINPTTTYTLTVSKAGSGSGFVSGPGINCGSDCAENYLSGTWVSLTAYAASSSVFTSWSGCDSASSTYCTVLMNSNRTITATFNSTNNPPVIVGISGPFILPVNTIGTWTVSAYDPDGDLAMLRADWGDYSSSTIVNLSGSSSTQSISHSYNRIGTKTIVFTVYDSGMRSDLESVPVSVRLQAIPIFQASLINSMEQQLNEMFGQLQRMLQQLR